MSLKKCPKCGLDVSETETVCPHCGYQFETEVKAPVKVKPEETVVTVIKRDRSVTSGGPGAFIVAGVFLVPLIIGIFMIIIGAKAVRLINKNNRVKKDLVYFDKSTDEFIVYDIKGNEIRCKAKEFKDTFEFTSSLAVPKQLNKGKKPMGFPVRDDIANIDSILSALA